MERKDDRLVGREQRVEIMIRQTVRMLVSRAAASSIDDIDDADFRSGAYFKEVDSGQRLQRWHVTTASHHDIGPAAVVVAGPFPDTESSFAMLDRSVHRQPLRSGLLSRNDRR